MLEEGGGERGVEAVGGEKDMVGVWDEDDEDDEDGEG